MYDTNRGRDDRRRQAPRLEALEARELPTFTLIHPAAVSNPTVKALRDRAAAVTTPDVGVTSVNQGVPGTPTAPPPNENGGLPTPHEVNRQRFVGRFKGSYVIGPGRYTDQAAALSSTGYGGANQSLHLWTNMRIVVPKDPKADILGQIYIIPWTNGTTGTQLVLDLKGDPTTSVNGFPTHYTWTVNGSSAGLYTEAEGTGTMDVKFFRPGRGPNPGTLSGQLQFSVNGFINVAGIFNNLSVLGNIPK